MNAKQNASRYLQHGLFRQTLISHLHSQLEYIKCTQCVVLGNSGKNNFTKIMPLSRTPASYNCCY